MPPPDDVIALFLTGARVVADALADREVAAAWDRPSVLEGQTVGGLAGHLARGGIWVVGDYLDGPEPPGPVRFASAGDYFATFVRTSTEEGNLAIRARGASVAESGPAGVVAAVEDRLPALGDRLHRAGAARRLAVVAGSVMHLGDYLVTRIVEQTVHLDDLARSVGREPWPVPAAAVDLALTVATEIGTALHGGPAMLRALYRDGSTAGVLPVL